MIGDVGRGVEEVRQAPAEVGEHKETEKNGSRHEQNRLDDLDPGCRQHSAEDDVDDHEDADADDRGLVADMRTA